MVSKINKTKKKTMARTARPAPSAEVNKLTVTLPQLLIDGSDLKFRELIADLFAAAAGMLALRRALAAAVTLSAAEFAILLAAWQQERKGEVGITSLAREVHVAAANVTAEVGRLVRKGILHKRPHPGDTRAVLINVTEQGHAILGLLTPVLRDINDRLFVENSARDINAVGRFLRHIASETPYSISIAKTFGTSAALDKGASEKPARARPHSSSSIRSG
jgi:MarR family transcriptional regulator, organic hydroperoxide resistance regulator